MDSAANTLLQPAEVETPSVRYDVARCAPCALRPTRPGYGSCSAPGVVIPVRRVVRRPGLG